MPELIYAHDPMCSWCWGFRPTWLELRQRLPSGLGVRRLLGGLAPDNDRPMPRPMREQLQRTWRTIQAHIPGTGFNFEFWTLNTPRRSTYPACRAVIAARRQGVEHDERMTHAIQQAYYLRALNPSDTKVLLALAHELGLDDARFRSDLGSADLAREFQAELVEARRLRMDSFPSLALGLDDGNVLPLALNYLDAGAMLEAIEQLLET